MLQSFLRAGGRSEASSSHGVLQMNMPPQAALTPDLNHFNRETS